MITRIEIDGFKTFQNFGLDLQPFQVIIGPNGAGKSNLFDALRLLSHLADTDLLTAFHALRGESSELFTVLPSGGSRDRLTLAVELLVEHRVQDSWGAEANLKHTRLRYELGIERRKDEQGLERLYVTHEALIPIARGGDSWVRRNLGRHREPWCPQFTVARNKPFISTETPAGITTIYLHQDGHGGRKASVAEKIERTVLSGVANTEFPHAFAVRQEIRSWRFLQLNPEVLREPSPLLARRSLSPDGGNLSATLARLQAEDPYILSDISRDLANLVPGIVEVTVEEDPIRSRYVVHAKTQDGHLFSSRVLSDGTLRLLALVTLKNDPQHRGLLCFEEPENGVHPFRLMNMAQLLRSLATHFDENSVADEPLRQILVNTHSPVLARQPEVRSSLLFANLVPRVENGHVSYVTRIVPVVDSRQLALDLGIDTQELRYTLAQVDSFLHTVDLGEARTMTWEALLR